MATVIHEPSFGEGLGAGFSQGLDQFMMMKQWNKFLDAYQARQQGGQPQTGAPSQTPGQPPATSGSGSGRTFNNPMAVYGAPGQTMGGAQQGMAGGQGGAQGQNPILQRLMQGLGGGLQGLGGALGGMGRGLGGLMGFGTSRPTPGAPIAGMPPINRQGAPAGGMNPFAAMMGGGQGGGQGMDPKMLMILQQLLGRMNFM